MKSFRKNVLRLAWQNKSSIIGSVAIIAIGIFVMVSMLDTLRNLTGQVFSYYESYGLADVFVNVRSMPSEDLKKLSALDGIEAAEGRLSEDVRMLCEGQEEISTVHLVSYMPDASINRLELSSRALAGDSLYIGRRMSEAYSFSKGTPIELIIRGKSCSFSWEGTVSGPEYIYSVGGNGALVPDGTIYDIAAVSYERLARLTGQEGCVNEIGIRIAPGWNYEDVRSELNNALEPYGLLSVTRQKDQSSVAMVRSEMNELLGVGTAIPLLFMAITVYMLCMSLKKMIEHDQTLIGSMKAFGMRNGELIGAYMIEGVAIGAAGALLGSILARPLGIFMFKLYLDFFTLPVTEYRDFMNTRLAGAAAAIATSVLAVFLGCREVLSITPAMAMKSRSPEKARQLRLPAFMTRGMDCFSKLALRSMIRNPVRGFLVILAVAFPFGLSVVLLSFSPAIDDLIQIQFDTVQSYDLMLSVDGWADPHRLEHAGLQLEGAEQAEAVCSLPVELKNGNLREITLLNGLRRGSELWRIGDSYKVVHEPPTDGLILNSRTARDLHLSEGDWVELSFPTAGIKDVRLRVNEIIEEIFAGGCYTDLESFPSLFGTAPPANTLLIKADPERANGLKEQMRGTASVSTIVDPRKIAGSYKEMFGSMTIMIDMFAVIGVIAGFLLISNISMINIRERFTELGTLEVVGARKSELDRMLALEIAVFFALGLVLGLPTSEGIKKLLEYYMESESYSVKMTIPPSSYLISLAMCAVMVWAAWKRETKLIRSIALTDILKERE